jgi:hypothetical protein
LPIIAKPVPRPRSMQEGAPPENTFFVTEL